MFKNFQIGEKKKLQLRFNAYNFLNHPLWTFLNGTTPLKLAFDQNTGKLANKSFGTTVDKQGHRIIQVAAKFYF